MNQGDPVRGKRFVILGGGTAGWMAACVLADRWGSRGATVTLVESPEIGIIGVGEGSTPQLKAFFDRLGIAEAEWMPACDATYKLGIGFSGWSDRPGFEHYFHPFATSLDGFTAPQFFYNTRARRTGRDVEAHPDRFFLPTRLAAEDKAPVAPEHFPFEPSYGYHFDAYKVGAFLREHAVARLGAQHLQRRVQGVERAANGDIAALILDEDERLEGDFFIDCSGFRAVLFDGALGVPFIPFGENLFNDRAVVMPTPHPEGSALPSQTRATALTAGWAWAIPLTTRTGNGYVYSSAHLSPDEAEAELRRHIAMEGKGEARHLSMRVGRVRDSWAHNALAIGLSQGFLEPLEATALHIVLATLDGFVAAFEAGAGTPSERDAFNRSIGARYDGIRDYIVCHYKVNRRADRAGRDYWRACAANQTLSDPLKAVLSCWFTGGDLAAEIARLGIGGYYAPLSWHCLLAGYGVFPDDAKITPPGPDIALHDIGEIDRFLARCVLNFQDHRAALARLAPSC